MIISSRRRIAVTAVILGAVASLIELLVHMSVTRSGVSPAAMADSLILGFLTVCFALFGMTAARQRHQTLGDDLRRIAELNHQVRNALQVIVYGEYYNDSADYRMAVLAGVNKIEAALQELFPLVGERTDDRPWEAHNRARLHSVSSKSVLHSERRVGTTDGASKMSKSKSN